MKYYLQYMVNGTVSIEVDAYDEDEAKEKARPLLDNINLGVIENVEIETDEPFDICKYE